MKRFRTAVGILLALLMLFGCMPLALAKGAVGEKGERSPEAGTRSVVEKTLAEAAAFPDEDEPFPLTCNSAYTYDWRVMNATEYGDCVRGGGSAFGSAESKTITMYADVEMDTSLYPYLSFMMRQYKKCTLTITCRDLDTGADFTLLTAEHTDDMSSDWQGYYVELNDPNGGVARLHFEFSLTLYVPGSNCYCDIADLRCGLANSIDDVLQAPDSELDFIVSGNSDGRSYIHKSTDPLGNYLLMECGDDPQDPDPEEAVMADIFAAQGDVLSFKYACSLDYMDGANFYFGTLDDSGFHKITENEDENGDGYINNDGEVETWASYSYTIPSTGLYTFVWKLCAYSDASCLALDDISITPAMSFSRAVSYPNYSAGEPTFSGNGDWAFTSKSGLLCVKSGAITHSQSACFTTPGHIMDNGAEIAFDYFTSSEANWDKLNVYLVDMLNNGAETQILTVSGIDTAWHSLIYEVPARSEYSLRFEYKKDSSVSKGDDCAYVMDLKFEDMTLAAFIPQELRNSMSLQSVYSSGALCFGFSPAVYDGEIVLVPDNRGFHSTSAEICLVSNVGAGEKIAFDYKLSTEEEYDTFTVIEQNSITNANEYVFDNNEDWISMKLRAVGSGYSQLKLSYNKDVSMSENDDSVYLKNFRIEPLPELDDAVNPDDGSYFDEYEHADFTPDYFDVAELDGRLAAFVSGNDIGTFGTKNARTMVYGEYVFFDYKIVGGGEIRVSVDNTGTGWVAGDTGGEWIPAQLRIDYTGEHLYFTGDPRGGTVYIDNIRVGYSEIPLDEAVNKADTQIWFEPDSDDFIGVDDPYSSANVKKYALAANTTHAEMSWTFNAISGDNFWLVMMFLDPDDEPCGASVTFSINGEEYCTYEDYDIYTFTQSVQSWIKVTGFSFLYGGPITFTVEYDSPTAAPGQGLCIGHVCAVTPGATLDEALNVTGGGLHFTVPENSDGIFYPVNDGERIYAYPNIEYEEGSGFETNYSFEANEDLTDFIILDNDGDGSEFIRSAYHWLGIEMTNYGQYALYSASNTDPNAPFTDDWVIFPGFTVPMGAKDVYFTFSYMATGSNPDDLLEIRVLTGGNTDPELEDGNEYYNTIRDNLWYSSGINFGDYRGQYVRVAVRHLSYRHEGGLLIENVAIGASDNCYSTFSFTASVNEDDLIGFDLMAENFGDGDIGYGTTLYVYEDGVRCFATNIHNVYGQYGEDWGTYSFRAKSTGRHVYRFLLTVDPDEYNGLICVDNVDVQSTYVPPVLIEEVELLGYTRPDSLTQLPYDAGLYPAEEGYHIVSVTWYLGTATALIPAEEFVAGQTYFADIVIAPDAGCEFWNRLEAAVENDPDAWVVSAEANSARIRTGSFVCAEGQTALFGDVDGDGLVTMADVTLLSMYLNGENPQITAAGMANADANADGTVDIRDIAAIYAIIAVS